MDCSYKKTNTGFLSLTIKQLISSNTNRSHNNYAILDNCQSNEKEVNCEITKEKIEEILTDKNENFKIGAIDDNVGP